MHPHLGPIVEIIMTFFSLICRSAAAAVILLCGPVSAAKAVPVINSILFSSGPTIGGTAVTLSGFGFGTDIGSASVSFGGVIAAINAITDTEISLASPPYAGGNRLVNVSVNIGSEASNLVNFQYDAPLIFSIGPASGPIAGGGVITVAGLNFGTSLPSLNLTIGGESATILSAIDDEIMALIPAYTGGILTKSVMVSGGGATSNAKGYTYNAVSVPAPLLLLASCIGLAGLLRFRRGKPRTGFAIDEDLG